MEILVLQAHENCFHHPGPRMLPDGVRCGRVRPLDVRDQVGRGTEEGGRQSHVSHLPDMEALVNSYLTLCKLTL